MAPRRGGSGGAGAEGASRNFFEPPPLKRFYAWDKDGRNHTDIMAGGVDESGVFKGVYLSSVHMAALIRTLELSKVFMPTDVPTPISSLTQSLNDGVPLIIITRGCFGRDSDVGPGPVRNGIIGPGSVRDPAQADVWSAVRELRAKMPQVLITCIDVPLTMKSDDIQSVLEEPLSDYRELMFHDGTWYAPQTVQCGPIAMWCDDNRRKYKGEKKDKINFNRKMFAWRSRDPDYANHIMISWNPVKEERPKATIEKRQDLDFTTVPASVAKPLPAAPVSSGAAATFKRDKELAGDDPNSELSAVTSFLLRAMPKEVEMLQEAVALCSKAAGTLKGDPEKAFYASQTEVLTKLFMREEGDARTQAMGLKSSAKKPEMDAAAMKLVLRSYYQEGDIEKMAAEADSFRGDFNKKSSNALADAYQMMTVTALLKGDTPQAADIASQALRQGAPKVTGVGAMLSAASKAGEAAGKDYVTAAESLKTADKRLSALALQASTTAFLSAGLAKEAAASAKKLEDLGSASFPAKDSGDAVAKEEGLSWQALGKMLSAVASLAAKLETGSYIDSEDAMISAAKDAAGIFEELGATKGKTVAMQVVANCTLAKEGGSDAAKAFLEKFFGISTKLGLVALDVVAATVSIKEGLYHKAYASTSEIMVIGQALDDYEIFSMGQLLSAQVGKLCEKPADGVCIPVFVGGVLTLV